MEQPMTGLEGFGRRAAELQDRALASGSLEDVKARLLADVDRARGPRRAHLAFVVAFAIALLLAYFFVLRAPPPLTFAREAGQGRVGEWMSSTAQEPLPLRFSDGSSINLASGSRARIAVVDPEGATVVLERGELEVYVVHRATTHWKIEAGPYTVLVTGTRFTVRWQPDAEGLLLRLEEGGTRVLGPGLGDGRGVIAGETLNLQSDVGATALSSATPVERVEPSSSAEPARSAPLSIAAPPATSKPSAPVSHPWRELAAVGKFKESLGEADQAGFDTLVETSSAPDLRTLGDTARFAGDLARAKRAYLAVRSRFAGSSDAAECAFTLGRVAFDQQGAFGEAAKWFHAYLAEQPGGPFARDASGRLMEALERGGSLAPARDAARSYLERWPKGPHADKARSLLSSP